MTAQQERPVDIHRATRQTDVTSVSMSTILAPAAVGFVVRVALDESGRDRNGRRLCLADLPSGSRLDLDVTGCPWPVLDVVRELSAALGAGVRVTVVTASAASARGWHDALERVS